MNTTVKELRATAKELGIKNYNKMTKAELIEATNTSHGITEDYDNAYDRANNESDIIIEEEVCVEQPITKNIEGFVTDFDIKRYAKFIPQQSYKSSPISAKQLNLIKSLENNFKVSISIKDCNNFYDLSVKLGNVYNAILSGKVTRRPQADVEARVKAYAPTIDNKATSKQLEMITKLEKELGIKQHAVISTKQIADEVIKSLIEQKKNKTQALKEVAVSTTNIQNKLASVTFRTKFQAMMKRILA